MVLEPVLLDFGTPPRRRRRRRKDIQKWWNTRYNRFIKAGFLHKEAVWAADWGLSPRARGHVGKQVREVLMHRRNMIAFYVRHGDTEESAQIKAARDLEYKLEEVGEEELNLFFEVS